MKFTEKDFFKIWLGALGIDRSRIHIIQNEWDNGYKTA